MGVASHCKVLHENFYVMFMFSFILCLCSFKKKKRTKQKKKKKGEEKKKYGQGVVEAEPIKKDVMGKALLGELSCTGTGLVWFLKPFY